MGVLRGQPIEARAPLYPWRRGLWLSDRLGPAGREQPIAPCDL